MTRDDKKTFTHVVESANNGTRCPGCLVRVSLDPQGAIHTTHGTTDHLGRVTFYLHPGTYYLWRHKRNWIFDNPLPVTVG